MENSGIKTLFIFLSLLCSIILTCIFMIEPMTEEITMDMDVDFSFKKMFAYIKYYLSKLIAFLFRLD